MKMRCFNYAAVAILLVSAIRAIDLNFIRGIDKEAKDAESAFKNKKNAFLPLRLI